MIFKKKQKYTYKKEITDIFNNTCSLDNINVDHVIPRALGGTLAGGNALAMCEISNSKKGIDTSGIINGVYFKVILTGYDRYVIDKGHNVPSGTLFISFDDKIYYNSKEIKDQKHLGKKYKTEYLKPFNKKDFKDIREEIEEINKKISEINRNKPKTIGNSLSKKRQKDIVKQNKKTILILNNRKQELILGEELAKYLKKPDDVKVYKENELAEIKKKRKENKRKAFEQDKINQQKFIEKERLKFKNNQLKLD